MDPKDKMHGRRFGGRWAGRGGPGGRGGSPEQRERWQEGRGDDRPGESPERPGHHGHWRHDGPGGGPGNGPERPEAPQQRHEGRPEGGPAWRGHRGEGRSEGGPGRPERPEARGRWGEGRRPEGGPGRPERPEAHGHRHEGRPEGGSGRPERPEWRGRWGEGRPGGPGGPPNRPWGQRGGPRAGRGDVRAAVLSLLAEQPLHGYEIIQQITARSGGVWRPSPGSVYPALQLLEDQGLILSEQAAGRRVFHLTDEGRAHVEQHKAELAAAWASVANTVDDAVLEMRDLLEQVGVALRQVIHAGTPGQVTQARTLLVNIRRQLYRILADDESTSSGPATGDTIHSEQ